MKSDLSTWVIIQNFAMGQTFTPPPFQANIDGRNLPDEKRAAVDDTFLPLYLVFPSYRFSFYFIHSHTDHKSLLCLP